MSQDPRQGPPAGGQPPGWGAGAPPGWGQSPPSSEGVPPQSPAGVSPQPPVPPFPDPAGPPEHPHPVPSEPGPPGPGPTPTDHRPSRDDQQGPVPRQPGPADLAAAVYAKAHHEPHAASAGPQDGARGAMWFAAGVVVVVLLCVFGIIAILGSR